MPKGSGARRTGVVMSLGKVLALIRRRAAGRSTPARWIRTTPGGRHRADNVTIQTVLWRLASLRRQEGDGPFPPTVEVEYRDSGSAEEEEPEQGEE